MLYSWLIIIKLNSELSVFHKINMNIFSSVCVSDKWMKTEIIDWKEKQTIQQETC